MQKINLFYIVVVIMGITLWLLLRPAFHSDLAFYGFAESNETEINYNYPVVVEQILVKPGESIRAGESLLRLSRRKSKESLDDQIYKIAELNAEEAVWRQKKENDLVELEMTKITEISEIDTKIDKTRNELNFKKSLTKGLNSIKPAESDFKPLEEELAGLTKEKENLVQTFELRHKSLKKELDLGKSPFREQIEGLLAEQAFEESQKYIEIDVPSPVDGLIGNLSCKEGEHIPSYKTLMTIYEPHSGIIKGYVHEDLSLEVQVGEKLRVSSLKNDEISYTGKVIGLGSRIVEIPSRLRKISSIKSYGREVLVEIPTQNVFLQKEKVSIGFISKSKRS